jgi:tryptophan-rich sensory protein
MKKKMNKIIKFIIAIVICQLAALIGSFFTSNSVSTWYTTLEKPIFNPPNWVFAPVWTILFVLMGISLYLIWIKGFKNKKVKIAILIFGIQLVLNVMWSLFFFGLQSPFYAFIEIIILWFAILFTIIKFYKISKTAAYLLFPYIIWVSFAIILNLFIWIIN